MANNVFLIKGPVTNADIRKMMAELMFTFMDSTETSGKVMRDVIGKNLTYGFDRADALESGELADAAGKETGAILGIFGAGLSIGLGVYGFVSAINEGVAIKAVDNI